jgi:hypothetical protein
MENRKAQQAGILSTPNQLNQGGVLLNQGTSPSNVPNLTQSNDKQVVTFLRFLASTPGDLTQYVPIIDNLIKTSPQETAHYLNQLRGKMQFNSNPQNQTRNPQNGAAFTTPQQDAESLAKVLEIKMGMMQGLKQTQTPQAQAPAAPAAAPAAQPANTVTAQIIQNKKKTRGNPFRVLMGKVGKLLDHGLTKNKIVKYLSKEKYWSKEIIEKAVDIVKDYNKKKHRTSEMDSNIKRIIKAEAEEVESIDTELSVLSTAELLKRKEFMEGCLDGVDLGFEPKNPRKILNAIERILKDRE